MSSDSNNKNGGRANVPQPAPPRSMLASLLSSQQRSAAQSRKHLVQRALPFANLHKEGSSGNAAMKSFSCREGPSYTSSQAQKAARIQEEQSAKSTAGEQKKDPQKQSSPPASTRLGSPLDSIALKAPPANTITLQKHSFTASRETQPDAKARLSSSSTHTSHDFIEQEPATKKRRQDLTGKLSSNVSEPKELVSMHPLKRKRDDVNKSEQVQLSTQLSSKATATTDCAVNTKSEVTPPENIPKRKKKQLSPWRVKVGCVVAVRFRKLADGGNAEIKPVAKDGDMYVPNNSSSNDSTGPMQARAPSNNNNISTDDKDVPKSMPLAEPPISDTDEQPQPQSQSKRKSTKPRKPKLFEVWTTPIPGEDGIALLGRRIRCSFPNAYIVEWQKSNGNGKEGSLKRIVEGNVVSISDNDCEYEIAVGLLIDRSLLKFRPYLQPAHDDWDDSKLSSSEQKRRNHENKIRGEDKVVVKVLLRTVYRSRIGYVETFAAAQWVVAKHVLVKPKGMKPTKSERKRKGYTLQSLFVGDGNDSPTQQEENWRWNACRSVDPHPDDLDSQISIIGDETQLFGEVVKIDILGATDGSDSLATVTIRRLLAPHQTKSDTIFHKASELFDSNNEVYFQAPVEQIIVIGKRVVRHFDTTQQPPFHDFCYTITHSYDSKRDIFTPLSPINEEISEHTLCHSCRRLNNATNYTCHGDCCNYAWCIICLQSAGVTVPCHAQNWIGPCCSKSRKFPIALNHALLPEVLDKTPASNSFFSRLVASVKSANASDFALPAVVGVWHKPSYIPYSFNGNSKQQIKTKQRSLVKFNKNGTPRKKSKNGEHSKALSNYGVFKPTCSRLISFEEVKSMQCYISNRNALLSCSSTRENAPARKVVVRKVEETNSASDRAARANQRRMLKSLGIVDSVRTVDRLAGRNREEQLRFGRSLIHGWGCFATEPISAGDMIIEYRGELIGNAVADKREIEYER